MKVESDRPERSEKTDRPEKTEKKSASRRPAEPKKSKSEKTSDADAEVALSAKGKAAAKGENRSEPKPMKTAGPEQTAERAIGTAESLMEHVNSGKLSEQERELALGRVGDILKKYGNA